MTWRAARTALAAILADVAEVDVVLTVDPTSAAALGRGVAAVIPPAPPARSSRRTPGGRTEKTYQVNLTLTRLFAANSDAAALAIDAAVEAIDDALESHITLGGAATTTEGASWTEPIVADYPPGSKIEFMMMTATIPVTLIRTYQRAP